MLRSEKKQFVSDLEEVYKSSSSVIVTHYHGLTVSQLTKLRQSLRSQGAKFKVIKNTLSKIAANDSEISQISGLFSGPSAIAYSEDPIAAAKGVVEFAKDNEQLKIIGGVVDGKSLTIAEVKQLAELPSMDELRGKFIGILQAPATKLATVLQAPASQLARVINGYANKNN